MPISRVQHNVNAGCKQLAAHLGIDVPLSTYYIRHTWATLASEECGISEADIALALNHVGQLPASKAGKSLKTTRVHSPPVHAQRHE